MALVYNRVKFTEDVDNALGASNPKEQLTNVQQALTAKRETTILAVRGDDLDASARRQYNTLLTLFKEQLSLLDEMIAPETDANDIWRREMKLYPRADGTLCCRCGAHELLVGDDFPAAQMLVCTPLSRVARHTMLDALCSNKLYIADGPAGTGKTETIKDTFRILGMEASVVNCAEEMREAPTDAIGAAVKSGGKRCPVVLDEFNRVDADAMTAIVDASSSRSFCTMTFNSGYAGRSEVPEALRAAALEQKMTVPDYGQIAVVMLSTGGFARCDMLGMALATTLAECREKTAKHYHYDYGMRFLKAVCMAASAAACTRGYADEPQLLADVLGGAVYARCTADDRAVALAEVERGFGVAPALPEGFEGGETVEARVAAMVAAVARDRHGVAVVGSMPDVDAAVAAIGAKMGAESVVVCADELFGADGPFTKAFKAATQKSSPVNIVVTTPLKDGEPLRTVLDDNKALCLEESGERIKMTPNMRVILIEKDCALWSPALVSRVGIVSAL